MLEKKDKHTLIDLGIQLIPDRNTLNGLLNSTNINRKEMIIEGPPISYWESVVDKVVAQNKVPELIRAMLSCYDENPELIALMKSIEDSSFPNRIEHVKSLIRDKKCVLFLGPEFFTCLEGGLAHPFNRYFSRKLAQQLGDADIFFERGETDNLSYIINRFENSRDYIDSMTGFQAARIYESGSILKNFYYELFRMGFPLIINTNPDTIIPDEFPQECIRGHYDQTNNQDNVFEIPEGNQKTIVYNIFGSFVNPASILFTERQAVDFTRKAYQKLPAIPREIKEIVEASHGLFIGFNFFNWHFKILFDVLELRHKPGNYSINELHTDVLEQHKEYYQSQYNMSFLKNDLGQVITSLK